MNPDTTPTPRTNAAWNSDVDGSELEIVSKQLERELTEKTNEVARLREELKERIETQSTFALALLEKPEREVARLHELLEKVLFELEKVPFQNPKLTAFTAHRLADRYREQLNQLTK